MHRWLTAGALLFVAVALAAPDTPADLGADLQRIKKVGREGAGNAEAAKAWKAIVARGRDVGRMARSLRGSCAAGVV